MARIDSCAAAHCPYAHGGTGSHWLLGPVPPVTQYPLHICSVFRVCDHNPRNASLSLTAVATPCADFHNMSTTAIRGLITLTGPTAVKVLQHSPPEEQKQVLAVMKVSADTESHS
jgi:hypothetical protein